VSEPTLSPSGHLGGVATPVPSGEQQRVESAARATTQPSALARALDDPGARSLGLVIALAVLVVVGIVTGGERFASADNALTILRFASVVGVVSIGMTFVIIGGGIDLSVGAILALASIWSTTVATQALAADTHWIVMVGTAVLVGGACGLINGVLVAYGRLAPFIATLAMLAARRGLAEIIAQRRTQLVSERGLVDFFGGSVLGIPRLVVMFALVAVAGWVVLNRTTYGRRTLAVGGNPRRRGLAGIRVQRHIASLYVLLGTTCGIAAVMIVARTDDGSSTHGTLLELDSIAAVVIGGTLLSAVAARSSAPSSASSSSRRSRTSSR
jgi:ribose transport system permease protein